MALLQITECGKGAAPHEQKLTVGIDLGTTNTLVASVRSGTVTILNDIQGRALIPSIVHYSEDSTLIGYDAQAQSENDSTNTIISVKRLMGRSLADIQSRYPYLPYVFTASENGLPLINTRAGNKNPIEVSADILRAINERAKSSLGDKLEGVVITVPAYFDDAQRAGTKDAAKLAGLNVLRLLNEPTAAAIAYGLDSGQEGIIAVYDFGGGTFDISILCLSKGVFEVLATGGDSALGGDDFDHLIADWIAAQSNVGNLSGGDYRRLLNAATATKVALSNDSNADINVLGWQGSLNRVQFNELISALVNKTLLFCRRALKDALVTTKEISEVVMVGGSTRVPLIREKVGNFFGRIPLTDINPDTVVAIGAATQADILVGNKPNNEMLLLDVMALSLGIETIGGLVEKIIPRNTTIPIARTQEFTTFKDGQTGMKIHVVQGERDMVGDCRSLANFTLKGIPPMTAGTAHIRVTYQVDADGLLSVTAKEKSTEVQSSIQVNPSYGLSDDEASNMLRSSFTHAQEDKNARYLAEQRIEANRMIEGLLVALDANSDELLSKDEKKVLISVIEALILLQNGNDASAIEQGIKDTEKASRNFVLRHMDKAISEALTGHSIDEI
ncbi:Fe-S protein assembly chaperone HscA [Candidatus Enterovibrio altilux]|uniref:Chaperone protein HscA homolog n=1 Tax=Candidatus Enterovibrio altilux TaxID=1927128 RepID=A0A291BB87_9GAMM|nr:Fe-S protein assembly chaperone HscA [Candidatus Enterovibrio luxaltus]ATF10241.1 Chaperone protein HscA [Candidatus Enterovibrio luxaltus]